MIIASSFSMLAIITGIALVFIGLGILGWVLAKFTQQFEDPEDFEDITHWEEYTASDGKTYYWPNEMPRSSRNNKNKKTA